MKRPTEAFRSPDLFESGWGYVVVARYKADGRCEAGFFLLDVFCMGVKDAGFETFGSFEEFQEDLLDPLFQIVGEPLRMTPAAGRKLIEEAVAYASDLGFAPSADYRKAARVFGGISAAECEEEFVFGNDGMPLYVQGSRDSPERCQHILETLTRRCGEGRFHYLISAGSDDLEPDEEVADEEIDLEPDEDAGQLSALEEMARRYQAERPGTHVHINPEGRTKLSDRLSLVAQPLLETVPDYESKRRILLLAALAWNLIVIPARSSKAFRKEIRSLGVGAEGEAMILFLATRVFTLFPDEDRLIVKVETDPVQGDNFNLRVMSAAPGDQPAAADFASQALALAAPRSAAFPRST